MMNFAYHPVNLGVRFCLEVVALIALGAWGASLIDGALGIVPALGVMLFAVFLWGTFRVQGDPSNNGKAPIQIPGILRLLLEWGLFIGASLAFFALNLPLWAVGLLLLVMVHYILSFDRINWIIQQ